MQCSVKQATLNCMMSRFISLWIHDSKDVLKRNEILFDTLFYTMFRL